MAKYGLLGIESALCELQKLTYEENAISLLKTLNKIKALSKEETEFLNDSEWILVIMTLLEKQITASDICLKILLNASKKHEEVRCILLKNKIFNILTIRLREETDFWKSNLILYSALIVVLVQGNYEAQNQLRISGCLSSIVNILSCILDDMDNRPVPYKNTELIIYTIITSNKNPHNLLNQTEIGWIIPKVLEYLEEQISFSDSQQFQLIEAFWLLLKSALEKNEANQQIFLKFSGVSILFRSIQEIVEDENSSEKINYLVKITGTLLKMRRNTELLYQASHYCPVMVLCKILKMCNCLVVQQIVVFLNILTQEFPHTLQIMKTREVQKQLRRAKLILTRCKITAGLCQNLWERLEISDETQTSQESSEQFSFFVSKNDHNFPSTQVLEYFNNHLCIIHNFDFTNHSQLYLDHLFNFFPTADVVERKDQNQIVKKIMFSPGNIKFYRKQLRENEKRLKKIKIKNFNHLKPGKKLGYFGKNLATKIIIIFQKFFSFSCGDFKRYFNKNFIE